MILHSKTASVPKLNNNLKILILVIELRYNYLMKKVLYSLHLN